MYNSYEGDGRSVIDMISMNFNPNMISLIYLFLPNKYILVLHVWI